jgi:O-antigen/teichoic acid export membrane protein
MAQQFTDEIKIAREATIKMGGTLTSSGLKYLFYILAARLLGVELLGLYALTISVVHIGLTIGKLGLGIGVVRFVAKYHALGQLDNVRATIRRGTTVGLISSLIAMVTIILSADFISVTFFHAGDTILPSLLRGFALVIPLMTEAQILSAVSQGFKILKYKVLAVEVIPNFFMILVFGLLAIWAQPLWSLTLSFNGAHALSLLAAIYFLGRVVPFRGQWGAPVPPNLVRYSLPLMMSAIMSMLLFMSDIFMLGALVDSYATGLYQPALRTASIMAMLIASFGSIFAPMVSGLQAQNNIDKIQQLLRLVCRWGFSVTWPLALYLLIYAPKVMLLFGNDFLAGWPTLCILAGAQVLIAITSGNGIIFGMTGYPRLNLINNTVALVSNVIANAYLIPQFGIVGAAWGSFMAIALLAILRLVESWVIFRLHPFSLKLAKPIVASLVAAGACYLINFAISDLHSVLILLIGLVIFATIAIGVYLIMGVDHEEKEVLKAIRRKIGKAGLSSHR